MAVVSEVVQFREDTAELEFLRKQGVNPNEFAKRAFQESLDFMRAQKRFDDIRALKIRFPPGVDIVKLIREDRESH